MGWSVVFFGLSMGEELRVVRLLVGLEGCGSIAPT